MLIIWSSCFIIVSCSIVSCAKLAATIPPVLIIAAQLLLAVLFGFLGLLLAVPIVAVVFVLVKMIYVEDILGRRVEVKGEPEAKKEVVLEVSRNE